MHNTETITFGDGAAQMHFLIQGTQINVTNWSVDPQKFQSDFWDTVRDWFRSHHTTVINVVGIMDNPQGKKLAEKLNGNDKFSQGRINKIVITQPPTSNPSSPENWSLGNPQSQRSRKNL